MRCSLFSFETQSVCFPLLIAPALRLFLFPTPTLQVDLTPLPAPRKPHFSNHLSYVNVLIRTDRPTEASTLSSFCRMSSAMCVYGESSQMASNCLNQEPLSFSHHPNACCLLAGSTETIHTRTRNGLLVTIDGSLIFKGILSPYLYGWWLNTTIFINVACLLQAFQELKNNSLKIVTSFVSYFRLVGAGAHCDAQGAVLFPLFDGGV